MTQPSARPTFEVSKQPNGQWAALQPQVQHGVSVVSGWPDVERLRHEWAADDVWGGDVLAEFVADFGQPPATSELSS